MGNNEELLSQFIGVTNCDPEFARGWLDAGGWDLNEALNLYLGGGGTAPPARVKSGAGPSSSSVAAGGAAASNGLLAAKEASLRDRINQIMSAQGVDEETARAIASAEIDVAAGPSEDGVRAPIMGTSGRLIENAATFSRASGGATFRDFEAETRAMEAMIARGQMSIGNSAQIKSNPTSRSVDSASKAEESASGRAKNLHDLFSPPRDMLFQGSWDEAREYGKQSSRWLLVNIQQDSEFLSYVLNRDLWSNEIIKDTIRHSFVFFQHESSDQESQRYITYYKPSLFPHVAIVDPFTGERMTVLELERFRADASDLRSHFLEKVQLFLEGNKLHQMPVNKTQTTASNLAPKVSGDQQVSAPKRQKQDEEENAGRTVGSAKPTEPDNVVVNDGGVVEAEPEAGENVTTVQFRLFDGRRLRRRFRSEQRIADLFAYVRQEFPDAQSKNFDLIGYPPRSLVPLKNKTLSEEKVMNTTLSAKWI